MEGEEHKAGVLRAGKEEEGKGRRQAGGGDFFFLGGRRSKAGRQEGGREGGRQDGRREREREGGRRAAEGQRGTAAAAAESFLAGSTKLKMKQADTDGQQAEEKGETYSEGGGPVTEDDADDGTDERQPKTADEDDAVTAEKRAGRWMEYRRRRRRSWEGRSSPGLSPKKNCSTRQKAGDSRADGRRRQDEDARRRKGRRKEKGERELVKKKKKKKKKGEKSDPHPSPVSLPTNYLLFTLLLARPTFFKYACSQKQARLPDRRQAGRQSCHQASEGGGDDAAPSAINPSSIIHVYGKPYGF
ncbi:hypothetical protein TRV_06273 [Trichophyton verrucosum HKI 0517]|uniref:Uncharacterized protein n=1 Tax=Trichophyton verrucosum (strain HKI 0517) TaxID=663202 RepID=D4DGG9_TRIVH|nr:uncharacterized protein TRV_06273 [Trichophyton verrucosum HKI 0517]EFE39057.1 hypothetical protein TRV_06273 [Trichophyton verrucosum HKI 0517]